MTEELYKLHRPISFKQVIGQEPTINTLTDLGRRNALPHSILFHGPSGIGKTTIARITARKLKCSSYDLVELNASESRGIDIVRQIEFSAHMMPMSGPVRVWIIDECHQLTSAAQDCFLKILEDTPEHVYFLLCTTDAKKLKKTILSRCTEFKLQPLSTHDIKKVITNVAEEEEINIDSDILDRIIEIADGGPRKALVLLHAISATSNIEQQIEILSRSDVKQQAIELARLLLKDASWKEVSAFLKSCQDEPESMRFMILNYMNSVALGGGKIAARAINIMEFFQDNFYDSRKAGLTLACFKALE